MSSAKLYAVNTTATSVLANGVIPLNQIVRRYGNAINMSSSGVTLKKCGYYKVDVNASFVSGSSGTVTVYLQQDNVTVTGANASVTASTDVQNLSFSCLVRVYCGSAPSQLNLLTNSALSVANVAVTVEEV